MTTKEFNAKLKREKEHLLIEMSSALTLVCQKFLPDHSEEEIDPEFFEQVIKGAEDEVANLLFSKDFDIVDLNHNHPGKQGIKFKWDTGCCVVALPDLLNRVKGTQSRWPAKLLAPVIPSFGNKQSARSMELVRIWIAPQNIQARIDDILSVPEPKLEPHQRNRAPLNQLREQLSKAVAEKYRLGLYTIGERENHETTSTQIHTLDRSQSQEAHVCVG